MTHDTGAIVVLEDWALLSELFVMYETPDFIRSDNGPEFIADAIREWLGRLSVQTLYVEPGSPWENGYAESFHSRVRDELFRVEEFSNVSHARARCHAWREDYNDYRPHSSLGGLPPSEFALPPHHPLPKHYSHNIWTENGGTSGDWTNFAEATESKYKETLEIAERISGYR